MTSSWSKEHYYPRTEDPLKDGEDYIVIKKGVATYHDLNKGCLVSRPLFKDFLTICEEYELLGGIKEGY